MRCYARIKKNMKNTHETVLLLVKLILLHWCFSLFKNCADGTKLCLSSQITPWQYRKASFYVVLLEVINSNSLSAYPTKWSNTLKQFIGYSRRIICVCLTILWGY